MGAIERTHTRHHMCTWRECPAVAISEAPPSRRTETGRGPEAEKTLLYWGERWHVSRRIVRDDHVRGSRSR